MKQRNLSKCRSSLAIIWLSMIFIVFIIFVLQITLGDDMYKNHVSDVVEWFSSVLGWALTMMVSVLAANANNSTSDKAGINEIFFRVTCGLSVVYLFSVILVVLSIGLLPENNPLDILNNAKPLLLSFQAVVCLSLGFFFCFREAAIK